MDFNSLQRLYDIDEEYLFNYGLLVFDTSALIDLYFYSEETALDVLEKSYYFFGSDRMFLPSQVKFEFDKNRMKSLSKLTRGYNGILDVKKGPYPKLVSIVDAFLVELDKLRKKTEGYVQTFEESYGKRVKHPYLSQEIIDELRDAESSFYEVLDSIPMENLFANLRDSIQREIDIRNQDFKYRLENDIIQEKVSEYFNIGREYGYAELLEMSTLGEVRYKSKIPPGYMDMDGKAGFQIYGDLIVWQQLLEYAKERNLPCIFVSNDTKEDWNEFQINTEGEILKHTDPRKPRVELLLEFTEQVNEGFKKLTLKDFIFELNGRLRDKFGESTLEEIRLEHLNRLLLNEKNAFVSTVQYEIFNEIKSDIIAPDEAFEYELENEDIYISFSSVVLPDNSEEINVTYEIEVTVICEMTYWEYWGRDDDTREAFLSPAGMITWSGTKEFKIDRGIAVDFASDTIRTVSSEIEIVLDDVHCEKESWGDIEDRGLYY